MWWWVCTKRYGEEMVAVIAIEGDVDEMQVAAFDSIYIHSYQCP